MPVGDEDVDKVMMTKDNLKHEYCQVVEAL